MQGQLSGGRLSCVIKGFMFEDSIVLQIHVLLSKVISLKPFLMQCFFYWYISATA